VLIALLIKPTVRSERVWIPMKDGVGLAASERISYRFAGEADRAIRKTSDTRAGQCSNGTTCVSPLRPQLLRPIPSAKYRTKEEM
jgi:hypothetical protein